jgi:hypothetical protein
MGRPAGKTNHKVMNQIKILSSRPKRTRISCCAAADRAACAAFRRESRMKLAEPTKIQQEIRGSAVEGPAVSATYTASSVFDQAANF